MNVEDQVYAAFVAARIKPGEAILHTMTPRSAHLEHMALGVCGEAGEVADAIKKHTIYNKPLDRENVVEELGDLEFFMEGIRKELGITRREVIAANVAKLSRRYPTGYSNANAIARADKEVAL